VPEGLEQVLPAPRPNRQVAEHRRDREEQPRRLSPQDLAAHAPQIDVLQEQADQQRRERQHDDRSDRRSHG
jgi:hypothetical protein